MGLPARKEELMTDLILKEYPDRITVVDGDSWSTLEPLSEPSRDTIPYSQLDFSEIMVGSSAEEVHEKVTTVLNDRLAIGQSNLSKGSHREVVALGDIKVSLCSFSDGLQTDKPKCVEASVSKLTVKQSADGSDQKLDIYMFQVTQIADENKEFAANKIRQTLRLNPASLLSSDENLTDQLKIHVDLKNRIMNTESEGNRARCLVIRGNYMVEASEDFNRWDSSQIDLMKGDVVIVLSPDIIQAIEQTKLAGVLDMKEEPDYSLGSKFNSLVSESIDANGVFNTEDFHNNIQACYNQYYSRCRNTNEELRAAGMVAFQMT